MSSENSRMPVLFLSHGPGPAWLGDFYSDCNKNSPSAKYLKNLRNSQLSKLPPIKAILVVSAHWEERVFTVQTNPKPDLYFDYYGFPPSTYEVKWPAPGAPDQAHRAKELLKAAGFSVAENSTRGLDHGVFVPLSLVFPDADVPVFEVSMKADYDIADHLKFGEALAPLRDEGVLIITSGHTTHRSKPIEPEVVPAFTKWVHGVTTNPDYTPEERSKKFHDVLKQRGFLDVHYGTLDHFLPIPVASAAAGYAPGKIIYEDYILGDMLGSHILFE